MASLGVAAPGSHTCAALLHEHRPLRAGEFVELEKDKKIVMTWRFRTWAEGTC